MFNTISKFLRLRLFIITIPVITLFTDPAHTQSVWESDKHSIHGQIRTGYYFIETRNNAGGITTTPEWRLRARLGITYRFNEQLNFTARLAGRYSTVQESFEFWYQPYAASPGGLRLGQTAFDIFYLQWDDGKRWMMQAGRMQHGFNLKGILAKGLDRYHSPNVSIAWADGMWLRYLFHNDWYIHGIFQFNHSKGSTSLFSPPLYFNEPGSRISYFLGIEGRETTGIWNQRELSITLIPSSFRNGENELSNYWALTGRLGINVPLDIPFMDVMIAGAAGYAPTTPAKRQLNLSNVTLKTEDAFAFQASINFQNIFGPHNFGILYGRTDPGWLLAPSFRNNTNTLEVRHQYRFNRRLSSEIRYRIRNQLYIPLDAMNKRKDYDLYARITYRF